MKEAIFALIDCNNFYVSCERVFNPALQNLPVVVLSNNDGCIVARSDDVKRLGVPMGAPFFKWQKILEKHKVAVLSSNYSLYGDMSHRVMETLTQFTDRIELYSIDEAFLSLNGFERLNLTEYARSIKATVERWTGIPASIGVASTKTLAKVATRLAKMYPQLRGSFNILGHSNMDALLKMIPVGKVWGIGRQYERLLEAHKIANARQLKYVSDEWIKDHLTVAGLRTVMELRGISCIPLEDVRAPRKGICCSRSFGKPVQSLEDLREAISEYASRAAEKLREQRSAASIIQVFVTTNPFKKESHYSNSIHVRLPRATANTFELVRCACRGLEKIYKPNYSYKKAGVLLTGIVSKDQIQSDLFWEQHKKGNALMKLIDQINAHHGLGTIQVASSGIEKPWQMCRENRSPYYTTRWEDLPVVKAVMPV